MRMEEKLYELFHLVEEKHWWFVGRRNIVLSLIDRVKPEKKRLKILDIGSGAGATLKELEEYGCAIGIDISHRALTYCRKRDCRNILMVGEEGLPFPNHRFDLVVALDVIEHIDDDGKALREYARILEPGGVLLVTVPAYKWLWSRHDKVNHHRRRYSKSILQKRLLNSGFSVVRLSYFCTYLFPLIVLVRMLEKASERLFKLRREELDFHIPAGYLNRFFTKIFSSEKYWLRRGDFPWGSSLLAICRVKSDE